ncbi:hypothetical protein [Vibrio alfacsensis]|nr:hypothetical protein [Vibrio alfacsensis]
MIKKNQAQKFHSQSYHQKQDLCIFDQMWIIVWAILGQDVLISLSSEK